MASLSEEQIRERAYHLWREAGEPAGRMDTFWYEAEGCSSPSGPRKAKSRRG
ncbi:DUF2934 domain-containing protein [Bradyrhizobium japonicum]